MRNFLVIIIILLAVILLLFALGKYLPLSQVNQNNFNQKVGGSCSYKDYEGYCEFTHIQKSEASKDQAKIEGGPGYEGLEARFKFIPEKEIYKKEIGEDLLSRERELRLNNSWYLGPQYLSKYDIALGEKKDCLLKKLIDGTCTPVIVEFDSLDLGDYFESRR